MKTETRSKVTVQLPDKIDLGVFTLTIRDQNDKDSEQLSKDIHLQIQQEFIKTKPLLSIVYDLVIEEVDVWRGCRKSNCRATLKRKKHGGIAGAIKGIGISLITALQLLSVDPDIVKENYCSVVVSVEQKFEREGYNVKIDLVNICEPNINSPFPNIGNNADEDGSSPPI